MACGVYLEHPSFLLPWLRGAISFLGSHDYLPGLECVPLLHSHVNLWMFVKGNGSCFSFNCSTTGHGKLVTTLQFLKLLESQHV